MLTLDCPVWVVEETIELTSNSESGQMVFRFHQGVILGRHENKQLGKFYDIAKKSGGVLLKISEHFIAEDLHVLVQKIQEAAKNSMPKET
jgi:hypothetical protein